MMEIPGSQERQRVLVLRSERRTDLLGMRTVAPQPDGRPETLQVNDDRMIPINNDLLFRDRIVEIQDPDRIGKHAIPFFYAVKAMPCFKASSKRSTAKSISFSVI